MTFRRNLRALTAAIVACVAVFTSCDRPAPNEVTALHPGLKPSATVVIGSNGQSYKLLEGQINTQTQSASQWIGPLGGTVLIVGTGLNQLPTAHTLVVPPLAVLQNTKFTMTLSGGNYVSVRLKAERYNLFGQLINVGAQGFNLPVLLTLSNANATNLSNPLRAVILYDPENGSSMQLVPSVAIGGQLLVVGTLNHFSKYCAAED
jgi:hypothetical protein